MQDDKILELVDLDRYPINDLDSPRGRAFLDASRHDMRTRGWCNFEGFIHQDALNILAEESGAFLSQARQLTISRNIYGSEIDESLPQNHPRRRIFTHHPLQLANDQIPQDSLINRLYRLPVLIDFVAKVRDITRLYPYADEFQALNIVALNPGEWHGWHYDYNECTVTLLLQAPEGGGEFIFLPDVRSENDENIELVQNFLDGDMSAAQSLGRAAGAFTLFRGEYSLHGVSEIIGSKPRITAIFTYDELPDRVAEDRINIQIYGPRVEKILQARAIE